MTAHSGAAVKIRSLVASLAAALLLAPGCQRTEDSTSSSPPNPVPRADLGRPVQPAPSTSGEGGARKDISDVEKDLHKDLGGSPIIKPDSPATVPPPPANPAGARAGAP